MKKLILAGLCLLISIPAFAEIRYENTKNVVDGILTATIVTSNTVKTGIIETYDDNVIIRSIKSGGYQENLLIGVDVSDNAVVLNSLQDISTWLVSKLPTHIWQKDIYTTTTADVLSLDHSTIVGAGSDGIGVGINFNVEDGSGNLDTIAKIEASNTTAAHATQAANLYFWNMGEIKMDIASPNTVFFGGVVVGDAADSPEIDITRNSQTEGFNHLKLSINSIGTGLIYGDGDLLLKGNTIISSWNNFEIGHYTAGNRTIDLYGQITALGAEAYIRQQVDDGDDNCEITRSNVGIQNYDIQMPVKAETLTANTVSMVDTTATPSTVAGGMMYKDGSFYVSDGGAWYKVTVSAT